MTEPKVYRADTPTMLFAKSFLGGNSLSWALTEMEHSFSLICNETGSGHSQMWQFTREDLANLWEMIGEALHHD